MNIFRKITLQSMKRSRTRTFVTVVGVILSAALTTAVATFGTSLLHFMVNGSAAKYGGYHVAFLDVDAPFVKARAGDREVLSAAVLENVGYAVLEGGKSPEKPYIFIAGFNEGTFETLPIRLISGRLPENSGEILVPAHVAAKAGVRFRVGDTLSLAVGSRTAGDRQLGQHDPFLEGGGEQFAPRETRSYKVVGICERPGFEEHSAPGYTMITRANAGEQAESLSVFVTLEKPKGVKAYAEGAAEGRTYILNEDVLRFMGLSENRVFNTLLFTVGSILTVIIMAGSVFLIYNAFNISMNERIRQFGILASVGATPKQLRNSVLFEGLCIGAAGIPIGIALGIGCVGLVIPIVSGKFGSVMRSSAPLTLWVSGAAVAGAAAVSLATILISAYIPARKAANTPVMECIRQTNEVKAKAADMKTSGLSQRILGLEGTLALKNFKRNKKRYHSIVLSLVLSVVLFVSGNAFGTTLKHISAQYVVDMDSDILFSSGYMDDSEMIPLYDKLKNAGGVYESSSQVVLGYTAAVKAGDFSEAYREYRGEGTPDDQVLLPFDFQFIEDGKYMDFIRSLGLSLEEYAAGGGKMIAVAKQRVEGEDGVSRMFDIFAGSSMTLEAAPVTGGQAAWEQERSLSVTFVDTYPVDPPPRRNLVPQQNQRVFMVIAPYSLKGEFTIPDIQGMTGLGFMSKNPAQSVSEMETVIQSEGVTSDYTLYNVYDMLEQFHSMTFVIDVFTYAFVIMISLIAVANVFNTISTNIRLRRRELAMLRSVGMADRDFNRMMHFECIFYGARTLLFGLPIAGIASWLIYKGLTGLERMENVKFAFPWGSMAVSVFCVLLIVFITMVYAVSRIRKENIIDALRDDMT